MSDKIRHLFEFEDFRLDAANPGLWRGDSLISISPKALETLILLVQNKGEIVSREELIETVWKDTFVEEGNINYTISLLRKTFDNKDLIQTIPRRGYRFAAAVNELTQNGSSPPESAVEKPIPIPKRSLPRWIFGFSLLIGLILVTSFVYFNRDQKRTTSANVRESQNSDALLFYKRGKMILESRTVENRAEKALDEFQKAVAIDPTLAIAYAGLAEGFAAARVRGPEAKGRENIRKAKAAAEKALSLDPNLAEGYVVRGWLKRNNDWDWPGAESDLRHAIELSPDNAVAHQRLAQTLVLVGKFDEALAEIDRAYQLDPVADIVLGARFSILEAHRDYDTALKAAEDLLRENKGNNNAARAYATFLYHKQDFAQVIKIGELNIENNPDKTTFAWLSLLAASYQATGQSEKAGATLNQLEVLSQTDSKALYSLTMNFAELGYIDEAFAALQKCFEMHEERMVWLNAEPRFANLRNDPRFADLLVKMNLR